MTADDLQTLFDTHGPDGWRVSIFPGCLGDATEDTPFRSYLTPQVTVYSDVAGNNVYPAPGPWWNVGGLAPTPSGNFNIALTRITVASSDSTGSVLHAETLEGPLDDLRVHSVVLSSKLSPATRAAIRSRYDFIFED